MRPSLVEQICEEIKGHLDQAARAQLQGNTALMRNEAETAAAKFHSVRDAGDPLQMFDSIRTALMSLGYTGDESDRLLESRQSLTKIKKGQKEECKSAPQPAALHQTSEPVARFSERSSGSQKGRTETLDRQESQKDLRVGLPARSC